ncbi:MAG: hypothetical protein ACSHWW_12345 [Nonlabens sp.]|uniref:hypothetical protein n=1 Tax=Nonlabens sp. TaxID=1888209 RepID=UPI003EF9E829
MNKTFKKQYNGIVLALGIVFFLASLYFEEYKLFFQIMGIILLMAAAYLYSRKRITDENDDEQV